MDCSTGCEAAFPVDDFIYIPEIPPKEFTGLTGANMKHTSQMSKVELVENARQKMLSHLETPPWSTREKLALTCRILFDQGHDSGLAGQVTARSENPECCYTQRLGLGLDEITLDNLLLVDEDLEVLEGKGMANPATRFHIWIYGERPDVQCIIHTHPPYISALSMLERPLKISHMDSCILYEDVNFLERWPGIPVGNEEGKIISAALGNKRALLLAHHGLVVACSSIEEACVIAIQCEKSARLQLLAEAAGDIRDIQPALAKEAHDWILQESRSRAGFCYYARRVIRSIQKGHISPIS